MDKVEIDAASPSALAGRVRLLWRQLKRRMREQSDVGDLTPSQIFVLVRLDQDGPLTLTALARAEGMRPQSMSASVAALLEAGRISSAPHPTDGRQSLLDITPACRVWLEAGRAARQDWLMREIDMRLSSEERRALAEALSLIERLVE
jgi:DNA-binding MarR family transcriptional regulator